MMGNKLQQRVLRGLEQMARGTLIAFSLLLILVVGGLDYATVRELSFSIFYLLPVGLVSWYVDRIAGVFVAGVGTLIWVAADFGFGGASMHPLVPAWNAGVRFAFFLVLTYTISALRDALDRERELARTDPLTGARNNRSFTEALEAEMRRSRRYEHPFTLVYLDVDNFKQVNDQHGHTRGDDLLFEIARTLRACMRATDVVARLGGDEFALLLPEAGPDAALGALGKMHERLDQAMRDGGWPVTFSIGAVTLFTPPDSVDACLERADGIMYAVKNSGKNRVKHEVVGEPVSGVRA